MQRSKKSKRIVIALVLLLFCVILGITIFYHSQPQLVTGDQRDLQQITVVERYPGEGGGSEGEPRSITTITDQQTMNAIYNELQRAWPKKETGGESFYTMVSPRYELTLHYSNKTDEVSVFYRGTVRYLGHLDGFTVSTMTRAARIMALLESALYSLTPP
ncbi:MAG: hypothetical protein FWD25_08455 [Clostridia bacterium]|nr:hypothetical protein [Clostridia bacterium]